MPPLNIIELPFSGACKWPVGEDADGKTLFCAEVTPGHKYVYCACHEIEAKVPTRFVDSQELADRLAGGKARRCSNREPTERSYDLVHDVALSQYHAGGNTTRGRAS